MLNNITIRGGLTLVISVFVAFLLIVIGVGYGALKLANSSLDETQHSAVALSHLKASSEKLLQVQLALGSYQTLFSVGKQTDELLPAAHKVLVESNKDFSSYMAGPFASEAEKKLAQSVEQARSALVDKAIEPEFKALTDFDFNTFRNIQGETANAFYATYSKSIDTLQRVQMDSQRQQAETAAQRFQMATLLFAGIGAIALVIGVMARVGLSAAVIKPVNATIKHFERIAAGDLTISIRSKSRNEMGQLLGALTKMRDGLVETVAKVRGSTTAITQGANEIASGNADLSSRTEQQAAALQQTAASMEQLSATVKQNADNAKQANRLAQGALDTVTRGGAVVSRVTETMDGISESSRKVAEIIGMIEGIAFQTNILALNAAVEAARAGEQGRGFAVVASEVRSLAQRSGSAAKEIKELIGESAAKVEQGASLVSDAQKTIHEAMDAVQRVTGVMNEIEASALEQSDGIEQVNKAVAQIDEVTQHNAALVEEAAAAAKSLEEHAVALRDAVAVFRLDDPSTTAKEIVSIEYNPNKKSSLSHNEIDLKIA
ncbi:methyl-accepting chemotaxis protein [Paraburkholderia fungorum]|uniref:methyl-accepting chemotaxis protein n=1 Tax=Paraburkholderia fungorum TaxID=134537 RepID=UPI0004808A15|nr:methyl-accepting chemotaxis protein [Paraburkholderia fungorum]MBB5543028.1 methyl-accepting chemotaxis protein [Paraburkholderia fungorum]PNE55150.1 methyl-accepting chemotaxis protein [Paraburkholderia fungorum]